MTNNVAPKQVGLTANIADIAASGTIALPAGTFSEQYRQLRLTQTTAGVVLTIPDPDDATIEKSLAVTNDGTADVSLYGVTLTADSAATFFWDSAQWLPDVGPNQSAEVTELLTPTGLNALPNLSSARLAGSDITIFVNGALAPGGVSFSPAGAPFISAANLTYNIQTTDTITVIYTPAL